MKIDLETCLDYEMSRLSTAPHNINIISDFSKSINHKVE